MKLLSLRLRGAIGIREGLGLEEININFREFGPGLITIIGENGAGKTTVIENLTPFRSLRSRPGGLARQFYLKDSCRDLLVEMNGDEYRFFIEMNPTTKTPFIKSYVYKNGECLNPDGNEESYSAVVTKLFGDPDLFFSSLFMPQKRVPFSKVEISKRKDLLLELIGAGYLQAKCDYASQSAKSASQDIARITGEIEAITKSSQSMESIIADIQLCEKFLESDRSQLVGLDTDISKNKADMETHQTQLTSQAVVQTQLSQARSRFTALNGELTAVKSAFAQKTRQLNILIDTDQIEIEKLKLLCAPEDEALLDECVATAEKTKAEYLATVEVGKEYDRLVREKNQAEYNLQIAKRDHGATLQSLNTDLLNAKSKFDYTKAKVDFKRKELTDEIARKTQSTEILKTVPCQNESIPTGCRDACKSCQFLKDATAAVQELAELSQRLATGEEDWDELSYSLQSNIGIAQKAVDDHPDWESVEAPLQAAIDGVKSAISALGFDAEAVEKLKLKYEECEKVDYPGKKQKIQEARAKVESLNQKVSGIQKSLTELLTEETSKVGELNQQVEAVGREIKNLEPQIDITIELRLRDIRESLKQLESSRQTTAESVARNETKLTRLHEDRARAETSAAELKASKEKLASLQVDMAEWDHLAQALSRTGGFQSMLVESAGAEMTPFANELLVLYGRPWTIEISTCRPSADGKKLVDGFFVTVNTPNGPRELSDLSGGEEVIVDQVIYDAIANMLRRRSGLLLQTAIKDEADGSLDGDRAIDYIKAVEAAHLLSGMHQTLLISHRESIQDLIPNRIRFIKGQGIILEAA